MGWNQPNASMNVASEAGMVDSAVFPNQQPAVNKDSLDSQIAQPIVANTAEKLEDTFKTCNEILKELLAMKHCVSEVR